MKVPDYSSDRVTVTVSWDQADGRHLWHTKYIRIDGVSVWSKTFYEDDEDPEFVMQEPNSKEMWNSYIESLEPETKSRDRSPGSTHTNLRK